MIVVQSEVEACTAAVVVPTVPILADSKKNLDDFSITYYMCCYMGCSEITVLTKGIHLFNLLCTCFNGGGIA